MINSTEPKYRKYVKGYGFLSFERKYVEKYLKKLTDTATRTEIDDAKSNASYRRFNWK